MAAPNLVLPGTPVFNSYVKGELDRRQNILEGRLKGYETSDVLLNHTARAPWIKLMSSVEISTTRARDFGITSPPGGFTRELARQNVLNSIIGTNSEDIPFGYEVSNSYGVRPQPGVTGMNIVSHNRFGSLRTMSVDFVCWDATQLDVLEVLYMRPGYTLLVEWGHSTYFSDISGVRNVISSLEQQFFGGTLTKHEIVARVNSLRKLYNGNYDGFFGFIKNFNWSLRVDGGYDCKTQLVALGELAESVPVIVSVSAKEAQEEADREFAQQEFEEARERFVGQDNTNIRVQGTSKAELDALRRSQREGNTSLPLPTDLPTAIGDESITPGIPVSRDINLKTNVNDIRLGKKNTFTFRDANGNLQTVENRF